MKIFFKLSTFTITIFFTETLHLLRGSHVCYNVNNPNDTTYTPASDPYIVLLPNGITGFYFADDLDYILFPVGNQYSLEMTIMCIRLRNENI